jgi:hypothetical protein
MPSELVNQGLLGLAVFTFSAVIVWQQKRIDTLYKEKDALQQARLDDAIKNNEKYTQVMDGFSTTTELLYKKFTEKS